MHYLVWAQVAKRIFADNCHVLSLITFVWSWSSSPKVVHWVVVLKAAWSMLVTSSDDKSRSMPTNYVSMVTVPPSSLVMSTLAHLLVGMTVPRENTHAVGEHRHLWVQMSPTRRPPIDWAEKCSARLPLVTPATTHYSKLTRPSSFVLHLPKIQYGMGMTATSNQSSKQQADTYSKFPMYVCI